MLFRDLFDLKLSFVCQLFNWIVKEKIEKNEIYF